MTSSHIYNFLCVRACVWSKSFKVRNANPSIFSEIGGKLPEILKEYVSKTLIVSLDCTGQCGECSEHGKEPKSKLGVRRKNSVCPLLAI